MEEKRLDIKDFQPYSSVSDNDKVLMAKGGTGTDASITIALLRTILTNGIKPEIKDGVWYIGGVSTGVSAGAVQLRLGENGIEYRYSDNDEWAMLITVSKLQEPAVDIANELKEHPCKVSENYTWMVWDAVNKVYTDTGISARGRSPIIRDMIWWVWDEEKGDYVSTGQAVNDTFVLTKDAVEGVFVGNVTGHHHLEYTVPTLDSVPTETTLTWTDSDNNLYMFYVGQLCRVADSSFDNGYKFYQLYDIEAGAAVWGEISGGGGVGKTYPDTVNGEIFNDYENNIALGKYSHAEGSGKTATFKVKTFVHSDIEVGYYDYDAVLFKPQIGDLHLIDGKVYCILDVNYNAGIVTSEGEFDMINIIYFEEVTFDNSVTEIVVLFNSAYGNASHREGMYTNSVGESSHAEGRETISQGPRAHAEGYKTKVFAADAHAEGRETVCIGFQGHAEGMYGIAHGSISHVEGAATRVVLGSYGVPVDTKPILSDIDTIRSIIDDYRLEIPENREIPIDTERLLSDYFIHCSFGERNHIEGTNNVAFSNCSHIEGCSNIVGNRYSGMGASYNDHAIHVEGCFNEVYALKGYRGIHVEGNYNKVVEETVYQLSIASHVEGEGNSIVNSSYSHVGGEKCNIDNASHTFAHGYYLNCSNKFEVSFGKFNASQVSGKPVLFSYGIGTSESDRKNAISVFSDGSVEIPKLTNSFDELKEIISDNYEALSSKITGILNLLSTDNIDKKAFVVADSLIITYKVDANVEGATLTINDVDFSVEDNNLIYESKVRAYVTEDNLYITESIDAKVDASELIIQDEKINVVNNNLNII